MKKGHEVKKRKLCARKMVIIMVMLRSQCIEPNLFCGARADIPVFLKSLLNSSTFVKP